MKHLSLRRFCLRIAALLFLFTVQDKTLYAQRVNTKYAWTTQMFLDEQKKQSEQLSNRPRRAPRHPGLWLDDSVRMSKLHRLIASPDTVGGVAYISCFIYLKEMSDLAAVRSLARKNQFPLRCSLEKDS